MRVVERDTAPSKPADGKRDDRGSEREEDEEGRDAEDDLVYAQAAGVGEEGGGGGDHIRPSWG